MAEYRLKIRIGDHEFEADGPVDAVKEQFEAFKELVSSVPVHKAKTIEAPKSDVPAWQGQGESTPVPMSSSFLDKIYRQNGRVVSLTAPPESEAEAVLLTLYGQRFYRENENATGSEILDGMEESGYKKPRIDRILKGLSDDGEVIITGAHRAKRYRLTNKGNAHAENIARGVIAQLP